MDKRPSVGTNEYAEDNRMGQIMEVGKLRQVPLLESTHPNLQQKPVSLIIFVFGALIIHTHLPSRGGMEK